MTHAPLLRVQGLYYRLGSTKAPTVIFNDFSFELMKGEFLTLLGPNGCGKSTLLKITAGLLPLSRVGSAGSVLYQGTHFLARSPANRARTIAYLGPEFNPAFPITAHEVVSLARTAVGHAMTDFLGRADYEVIEWAMRLCRCWEWRDRNLQTLSSGERQLVGLARVLAQGAKILFLDESLSQMDLDHQAHSGKILKELTKQGWSVILVSHDVNLASEWADTALLLRPREKIAQGAVRSVLTQENLKKLYPAAELVVGAHPVTGAPKVFFA